MNIISTTYKYKYINEITNNPDNDLDIKFYCLTIKIYLLLLHW